MPPLPVDVEDLNHVRIAVVASITSEILAGPGVAVVGMSRRRRTCHTSGSYREHVNSE